jgi:hypothetical protein
MREVEYQGVKYPVSDAHPAADRLPLHVDRPAFADTVADMRENGFDPRRRIIRDAATKRIIAGRRRELAAVIAGRQPLYEDVLWGESEIEQFVRREELLRRDLSPAERATLVLEFAATLPPGRPAKDAPGGKTGNVATLNELAAEAGVSKRTLQDVAKVKEKAADLLPALREGTLPVHTAAKVAHLPPEKRAEVLAAPDPKQAARQALKDKAAKVRSQPIQTRPMPHETRQRKGKPAPRGLGGAMFSFEDVEKHYGKLVRAVDDMARAYGGQHGRDHDEALDQLGALLRHLERWNNRNQKGRRDT